MPHFFKVSATQYALCLDGGICSTYCQTKERKAAGVCAGPTKWDCFCEDGKGNREPGRIILNIPRLLETKHPCLIPIDNKKFFTTL